jgi:hypothetical protein
LTGEPSCNDADHDYHEKTFTRHVHLRKLPEAEDWGELPGGRRAHVRAFPRSRQGSRARPGWNTLDKEASLRANMI